MSAGSDARFEISVDGDTSIDRDDMVEHREHGPMHVDQITIGPRGKKVELKAELSNIGLTLTGDELREQWGETIHFDPIQLHDDGSIRVECTGISGEGVNVEVDLTTEGGPERAAEVVHMYAKDAAVRALKAIESRQPAPECDGVVTIEWDTVFDNLDAAERAEQEADR
jgi:hypothetical protein